MSIIIEPPNPRPGQLVNAKVKYEGAPPPATQPNDVHIDVQLPNGSWRAITGYSTIPGGGQAARNGLDIPFSLGNANIVGPGPFTFQVRWTHNGTNMPGTQICTYPPAAAADEPGITKQQVQKVCGYTIAFLFLTPFVVLNAITLVVTVIVNEIAAAARDGGRDPEFARAVRRPKLRVALGATELLSQQARARVQGAIDAQFDHCAALLASAVATNRYYSAVAAGDRSAAAARLKDVKVQVEKARTLQRTAGRALDRAGQAVRDSDARIVAQPKQFRAFQEQLLRNGAFPAEIQEQMGQVISKFDPNLLELFDPYEIARRFALGMRLDHAVDLGAVLLAEATAIEAMDEVIGPFPGVHDLTPRITRRRKSK